MYKVLSGRLAAHFNLDGGHLERYLQREREVRSALCEELILHDRVIIPTSDYLTACGLIRILGEHGVIELLEQEKLTFIRLRGLFGYARGTGRDGALLTFEDPERRRPQDSDVESSVDAGLAVLGDGLREQRKMRELLVENSEPLEMSDVIGSIQRDAYEDLKGTLLWRPHYGLADQDLLALPGIKHMEVRVIGPDSQPSTDAVDALLALANYDIELYLADTFSCDTLSSSSPLGDLVEIKARRLVGASVTLDSLCNLLEVDGIPDLGAAELGDATTLRAFLKTCSSADAAKFREWFHAADISDPKEILREYVGMLRTVPVVQRLPVKTLRFAVTTGLGFVPVLGQVASAIDTFLVDKLFRGHSPRFFLDDLRTFAGRIGIGD